jgi:hypothetical protein
MTTAAEIAARYGAVVKPGVEVQHVPRGVSGLPPLVYEPGRGLVYATKPNLQKLTWGRPAVAIEVDGWAWRSMGDLSRYLGVSLSAVSKAVKKGRVRELLARHEPKVAA